MICLWQAFSNFLKDYGVFTVVLTAFITYLNEKLNRKEKYKSVLKLLRDEVWIANFDKGVFDPSRVQFSNPVEFYALEPLLVNYFDELQSDEDLATAVWDFNTSVKRLHSFSQIYNDVISREPNNVEAKRVMFTNVEELYLKSAREERTNLLGVLEKVFKEMGIK